nr:hypothetical protein [uncultured archaeon]CCC55702.1 hypothetical protein [uncultured archaeon]
MFATFSPHYLFLSFFIIDCGTEIYVMILFILKKLTCMWAWKFGFKETVLRLERLQA